MTVYCENRDGKRIFESGSTAVFCFPRFETCQCFMADPVKHVVSVLKSAIDQIQSTHETSSTSSSFADAA